MSHYNPRDYAETQAELAREVLEPDDYREWNQTRADNARRRRLARERRTATHTKGAA